ncbi:MAG: WYL domain-containing protein [Spirochaetota bacterium]
MDNANIKKIIHIKSKIKESISNKKPLIFTYIKWNEYIPEERRVVFQEMYSRNGRFYATGYCFKRKDMRTFRLDRIGEIRGFDLTVRVPPLASKPEITLDSFPETEKLEDEVEKEYKKQRKVERAETAAGIIKGFIVLSLIGGLTFGYLLGNYPGMWEKVFGEKNDYYVTPTSILYTEVKGRNRNVTQEELLNIDEKYRGFTIEKKESSYRIKGLKGKYSTLHDVVVKINTVVFAKATGIQDEGLLSLYINADANKNGFLSWGEIQSFQMKTNRDFKYISNDTALRPDEFMKAGGGDCEDWALFTAGLLRFWNYEAYIGSVNFKDDYHAITIVRVNELPFRFKGYRITRAGLDGGELLPEGTYTYIDYYRVGRLTRAAGRKPRLVKISIPEKCYGNRM